MLSFVYYDDTEHFEILMTANLRDDLSCLFQKYNADYDLSVKEGADMLAFISLVEEKLMPALVRFTSDKRGAK